MKLTDKQQDILYIVISVIVGILLGVSVYLIIKHIRSKECDDNNPCPTGQTCQNKRCVDDGNNCSCDGKNCGDDNGCGTNCDVPCANGATCKPDSSEPCKNDPKPNPEKTCTVDKSDPYETGNCKPCCEGIKMYKIKGNPDHYICSSTKPDSNTLSSDKPFVNNTCPPTPVNPQPPSPSPPSGDICTKDNDDPYETGNCKPCCEGLKMYKIQEGQSPARFICSKSKPNNLTPGNPYTNTCPNPTPTGGSGGGSGGWEDAKKCSEVGVIKAGACGSQRYVCAPNKNDIPGCKDVPFRCDTIKCLNESN